MTSEEQAESLCELKRFLNTCISASDKVELKDSSISDSFKDYQVRDTGTAISFILNKIIIVGMVAKQKLGYSTKVSVPFVFGYIFTLKDDKKHVGYLAFHNNPRKKTKITLQIKSLHKDYQNVVLFEKHKELDITWLSQDIVNELPACKGELTNEVSSL